VIDHEQHAAGQALGREGEGAEGDEADLGERRVAMSRFMSRWAQATTAP